jgi:hypothetical protein
MIDEAGAPPPFAPRQRVLTFSIVCEPSLARGVRAVMTCILSGF